MLFSEVQKTTLVPTVIQKPGSTLHHSTVVKDALKPRGPVSSNVSGHIFEENGLRLVANSGTFNHVCPVLLGRC